MIKSLSTSILKHPTTYSDEDIMKLFAQEGNADVFKVIYQKYFPILSKYLAWLSSDYEMGRDVAQNILLKLYQNPRQFDEQRNLKVWLFSIANNQWKNELRSKAIRTRENEAIKYQLSVVEDEIDSNESDKRMKLLKSGLVELSEKHREVFVLKYSNNLSIKEISEVCSCSEGTVKSRLFYAMKYLKNFISNEK